MGGTVQDRRREEEARAGQGDAAGHEARAGLGRGGDQAGDMLALALGVVLQVLVVQVGFLQTAFGTASLDLTHWGVCVAMASSVLWFDEIRKLIRRAAAR